MIAYNPIINNSTVTYKDNTDLQKFIEGTYLPDKVRTLEELDNIDIKINELVENISDDKIRLANTVYNDLAIDSFDKTIALRDDVEKLEYYNAIEHKKLKKLAKLAILSKFI